MSLSSRLPAGLPIRYCAAALLLLFTVGGGSLALEFEVPRIPDDDGGGQEANSGYDDERVAAPSPVSADSDVPEEAAQSTSRVSGTADEPGATSSCSGNAEKNDEVDRALLRRLTALMSQAAAEEALIKKLVERASRLREALKELKERASASAEAVEASNDGGDDDDRAFLDRIEFLETITKRRTPRSCHEYLHRGTTKSGIYPIDPDGPHGDHEPIKVYCDLEHDDGVTWIGHDSQETTEVSTDDKHEGLTDDSYSKSISYHAPHEQIKALTDLSHSCHQEVEVEVHGKEEDEHFAEESIRKKRSDDVVEAWWWTDLDGQTRDLWQKKSDEDDHRCVYRVVADSGPNRTICTTGSGLPCDCRHAFLPEELAAAMQDSSRTSRGRKTILADKTILPLSQLFFGGSLPRKPAADKGSTTTSRGPRVGKLRLKHSVGPLKCRGKRSVDSEDLEKRADTTATTKDFKDCADLYAAGVHDRGYHWIRDGDMFRMVYCEMGKQSGPKERSSSGEKRLFLGPKRAAGGAIHFHVARDKPFNFIRQVPRFPRKVTDLNSDFKMDIGEFQVKTPGYYHFHLQYVSAAPYGELRGSELYLIKNQKSINGAISTMHPNSVGVTSAVMKLVAEDRIYARLFFGGLFSNEKHGLTYFTGSLLDAA